MNTIIIICGASVQRHFRPSDGFEKCVCVCGHSVFCFLWILVSASSVLQSGGNNSGPAVVACMILMFLGMVNSTW